MSKSPVEFNNTQYKRLVSYSLYFTKSFLDKGIGGLDIVCNIY